MEKNKMNNLIKNRIDQEKQVQRKNNKYINELSENSDSETYNEQDNYPNNKFPLKDFTSSEWEKIQVNIYLPKNKKNCDFCDDLLKNPLPDFYPLSSEIYIYKNPFSESNNYVMHYAIDKRFGFELVARFPIDKTQSNHTYLIQSYWNVLIQEMVGKFNTRLKKNLKILPSFVYFQQKIDKGSDFFFVEPFIPNYSCEDFDYEDTDLELFQCFCLNYFRHLYFPTFKVINNFYGKVQFASKHDVFQIEKEMTWDIVDEFDYKHKCQKECLGWKN